MEIVLFVSNQGGPRNYSRYGGAYTKHAKTGCTSSEVPSKCGHEDDDVDNAESAAFASHFILRLRSCII